VDPASTWKVVRPVVKALTPYAREKFLGTDLEAELAKAVESAWERAAERLSESSPRPCAVADLDELGSLVSRALHCDGAAEALVISVLDSSRPFGWAEHPQVADILDGLDPETLPFDARKVWEAFIEALRHEVVEAAGKKGVFELTVAAGLAELKGKLEAIEQLVGLRKEAVMSAALAPDEYLEAILKIAKIPHRALAGIFPYLAGHVASEIVRVPARYEGQQLKDHLLLFIRQELQVAVVALRHEGDKEWLFGGSVSEARLTEGAELLVCGPKGAIEKLRTRVATPQLP
jgi:hypothetical protein